MCNQSLTVASFSCKGDLPGLQDFFRFYYNAGLEVLPISKGNKRSLKSFKYDRAGIDSYYIEAGFYPTYGHGEEVDLNDREALLLGVLVPDGWVVFDIDNPNADEALAWFKSQLTKEQLRSITIVKTPSGGYHIWMQLPDDESYIVGNTGNGKDKGFIIDVRSWVSNNVVFMPGSVKSKGRYVVLQGDFSTKDSLYNLPYITREQLDTIRPRKDRLLALRSSKNYDPTTMGHLIDDECEREYQKKEKTGIVYGSGLDQSFIPPVERLDRLSNGEIGYIIDKFVSPMLNSLIRKASTKNNGRRAHARKAIVKLYSGLDLGRHRPHLVRKFARQYFAGACVNGLAYGTFLSILNEEMSNPSPAVRGFELRGWWKSSQARAADRISQRNIRVTNDRRDNRFRALETILFDLWLVEMEPNTEFTAKDLVAFSPKVISILEHRCNTKTVKRTSFNTRAKRITESLTVRGAATMLGSALTKNYKELGLSRAVNRSTKKPSYWFATKKESGHE